MKWGGCRSSFAHHSLPKELLTTIRKTQNPCAGQGGLSISAKSQHGGRFAVEWMDRFLVHTSSSIRLCELTSNSSNSSSSVNPHSKFELRSKETSLRERNSPFDVRRNVKTSRVENVISYSGRCALSYLSREPRTPGWVTHTGTGENETCESASRSDLAYTGLGIGLVCALDRKTALAIDKGRLSSQTNRNTFHPGAALIDRSHDP